MRYDQKIEFDMSAKGIPLKVNVNFTEETIRQMILDALEERECEPVVHAKWESIGHVYEKENMQCGVCGNCGKITAIFSDEIKPEHAPRCCWCGAHMDLPEAEE